MPLLPRAPEIPATPGTGTGMPRPGMPGPSAGLGRAGSTAPAGPGRQTHTVLTWPLLLAALLLSLCVLGSSGRMAAALPPAEAGKGGPSGGGMRTGPAVPYSGTKPQVARAEALLALETRAARGQAPGIEPLHIATAEARALENPAAWEEGKRGPSAWAARTGPGVPPSSGKTHVVARRDTLLARAMRTHPAVASFERRGLHLARAQAVSARAMSTVRGRAPVVGPMHIAPGDARALEKIWGGLGRVDLPGWGEPWLCNATGVQCGAEGRVSALDVSSKGVRGSLSSAVGTLLRLTSLKAAKNSLTGSLPSSLGGLISLEYLDLSYNKLKGKLPSSLGRLSSLQYLYLYNNLLTGSLPSSLERLTSLQTLDLAYNQLSGSLPSSLGGLISLQTLGLFNNQLEGSLPSSLGHLTNLQVLLLSGNQLVGSLPSSLGGLISLQTWSLCNNQLTGSLPPSLGRLTSLQSLYLNNNQLTGSLPSSLGGLINLQTLQLDNNQLNGSLPSSLGRLISLQYLDLSYNKLKGNLPSSLGRLSSLGSLDLSSNHLTGSLPSTLGGLEYLDLLNLSNNQLSGSLPSSLGRLIHLDTLDLSSNHLTGSLPSTLGGLTYLANLNLSSNQLSGSLPSSLGRLARLGSLDLSHNQLNRSLPSWIASMGSLSLLSLHNNQLSGSLPSSIGQVSSLSLLDVSYNAFSGELPISISQLFGLAYLDLGHNKMLKANTAFLSSLAGLSHLQHLGLALPQISTPFAPLRLPLGQLTFLSLQGANVSGTVPASSFASSPSLQNINLQGTAIQGALPSGLALLSSLSVLEVPGSVVCPPMPCTTAVVARSQAFCARCTAFCATCPAAGSFKDASALLRFQEASGNVPGTWTNNSFEGVTLDKAGHVQAINLQLTSDPSSLRFDLLPSATLQALSLLIEDRFLDGTLSSTLGCLLSLRALYIPQIFPPTSLSPLTALSALSLDSLPEGGLPTTLGGLQSLEISNIGLIAEVPSALSRYTTLTQLDLSGSLIPGSIPSFLSSLSLLANLDLSRNSFSGTVPSSFSLLSHLTTLNLGGNSQNGGGQLSLPSGLATLPLVYLIVDKPWTCLNHTGRSPCPPHKVNPSSPFCTRFCPHICTPCYPPPRPPPPPNPPPPTPPPPSPPPPVNPGVNVAAVAGAASAAGALVLLFAVFLGLLLLRRQRRRRQQDDDDIEKRGVRSLSAEEVEELTGSFSERLGGDGAAELFGGETGQGQRVQVRVSESGWGRGRREAEQAFRHEVWLLSGIHHRHLQALYGCCLTPGRLYLVFEHPEQGSLWGLLRGDPGCLTWARRLRIALTAALGLDYLHSQIQPPVVHKDVKSRSILVTSEFEAKVGAVGLGALELGEEGALGYADPSRGEQGAPRTKSDVYAFGVVLLELATGLCPLEEGAHILTPALSIAASEEGLEGGIPSALQGERVQAEEGDSDSPGTGIAEEVGSSPLLTVGAFKCFLELGIACCALKPQDRPTMAQVASTLEELLHGRSLPAAPLSGRGQVPFPEYAEPMRGPLGPTELLHISFTRESQASSSRTS